MGMVSNEVNIQHGTSVYTNTNEQTITAEGVKVSHPIADTSNTDEVKDILKRHQAGQTDFLHFVKKWLKLVSINGISISMLVLVHILI